LPDCLCLPNKLGPFWLFNFPLFARLMLNICPTFRLCNLFAGAAVSPAPRPVRLCAEPAKLVIIAGYFSCNKLYIVRIVKPIIYQLTIYIRLPRNYKARFCGQNNKISLYTRQSDGQLIY
jgi:hypothetical protein